jgi:hypothetical protein
MSYTTTSRHLKLFALAVGLTLWCTITGAVILLSGCFVEIHNVQFAMESDPAGALIHSHLTDLETNNSLDNYEILDTYQNKTAKSNNTCKQGIADYKCDQTPPGIYSIGITDATLTGFPSDQNDRVYHMKEQKNPDLSFAIQTTSEDAVSSPLPATLVSPKKTLFHISKSTDVDLFSYVGMANLDIEDLSMDDSNVLEFDDTVIDTAVPMPTILWLFGSGMIGLVGLLRTQHKK